MGDDTQASGTSPQATDERTAPAAQWRWWLALVLGLAVVALTVSSFNSDPASDSPGDGAAGVLSTKTDDFDRVATGEGLGKGRLGPWTTVSGTWTTQVGVAIVSQPGEGRSIATVQANPKLTGVSATVWGKALCGIIGRYGAPDRYVALLRVPEFGVWNLVEIGGISEQVIAKVPDPGTERVDVSLSVGDDVIAVRVGDQRTVVRHRTAVDGTVVGLLGLDERAAECAWDDFTVQMTS